LLPKLAIVISAFVLADIQGLPALGFTHFQLQTSTVGKRCHTVVKVCFDLKLTLWLNSDGQELLWDLRNLTRAGTTLAFAA